MAKRNQSVHVDMTSSRPVIQIVVFSDYVGHDIGKIREFNGYKGKGVVPRVKINSIVKRKKKYGYGYKKERNPKGIDKPDFFAVNTDPDFFHDPHDDHEKDVAATLLFTGDDFKHAKNPIPAPKRKPRKKYRPKKKKKKEYKPKYKKPQKHHGYHHQQHQPSKYEHSYKTGGGHKQPVIVDLPVNPTAGYNTGSSSYDSYVPPNQGYGPVPKSSLAQNAHSQSAGYASRDYDSGNGYDKGFDLDVGVSYRPSGHPGYDHQAGYGAAAQNDAGQGYGDTSHDQGYGGDESGSHQGYGSDYSYPEPHHGGYPDQPQYEPPSPPSYDHHQQSAPAPRQPSYHAPAAGAGGYSQQQPKQATPLSGLLMLLGEAAKPDEKAKSYSPHHHDDHGGGYHDDDHGGGYHDDHKSDYDDHHYDDHDPYQSKKKQFSKDEKVVLLY